MYEKRKARSLVRFPALGALAFGTLGVALPASGARFTKADFASTTSAGDVVAIASRCTENQLARERTLKLHTWIFGCDILPKGLKIDFIYENDQETGERVERQHYLYPLFAHKDPARHSPDWQIWVPPFDEYAATNDPVHCVLPSDVGPYTLCTESCLSPRERILFEDGYVGVEEAMNQQKQRVVTLSPAATKERPVFEVTDVNTYVRSVRDEQETLLAFRMKSGGSLRVTTNHPLVDGNGRMKDARELKAGDALMRADGEADEIVSIEAVPYFGRVFQLKPGSLKSHRNVYVAEGYLNGSANWQNETITDLNRIILRSRVAGLVPTRKE